MLARAGQYVLIVLAILVFNFALPRLMPGDPTDVMTGTDVDGSIHLDEAARQKILAYHGLDKPLHVQFLHYLGNLARLDLGHAVYFKAPVSRLLAGRLPWTLLLAGSAFVLSTLLGVLLGALAARRQGSVADRSLLSAVLGVQAMPAYLIGMLFIVAFASFLGAFPLGGASSPFATYPSPVHAALDILWHLALPLAVLVLEQTAGVFLVMRSSMVATLGEPYMTLAEAKGLSGTRKLFRYGMRNSILPLYTRLGIQVGFLVTGTLFIETVFNYPGMGRLTYEATLVHDYPVLQGVFLVTALSIVGANILVDCTLRFVDPRTEATK